MTPRRCECAALYGSSACESTDEASATVSYLPPHLTDTARAAGTDRGLRATIAVTPGCAANILRDWPEIAPIVEAKDA